MRFMQHVRRFRRAPGQTLVLFALMSLVLIAGLGLVIDAGVDYAARRRMQNAADTAALAGTRVIARQVSAPVPKRAAVWSAIFDTAVANGAPNDATRFACDYIDNARNALNQPCSDNGSSPIPNGATGIRIRVTEQHTTFFMRAIGIKTSGTAATSTAQVQVVRELSMYDIPFMVCGIYSPNGAAESILEARDKPDPVQPKNGPQATPQAYITTLPDDGVARIKESAYSYDWNVRESNGDLTLNPSAPDYLIYSDTLPKKNQCSLDQAGYNWHGVIEQPARTIDRTQVYTIDPDNQFFPFLKASSTTMSSAVCSPAAPPPVSTSGPVSIACPEHDINGTRGCPVAQLPNDCIMPLPIVISTNPSTFETDPKGKGAGVLDGRVWGVFWIKRYWNASNNSYDYRGRLIKNYPLHVNGANVWSTTYPDPSHKYGGPVTVNLVK